MVVVSDTSPVNYLVLIGEVQVLQSLYGQLLLPQVVKRELEAKETPARVRDWMAARPPWVDVRAATAAAPSDLSQLHAGEIEAITLAKEVSADLLLMDDMDGRKRARELGINVVGTLGILDEAAGRGLVEFTGALRRLLETNFRVAPDLLERLRERDARRKEAKEKEKPSGPA